MKNDSWAQKELERERRWAQAERERENRMRGKSVSDQQDQRFSGQDFHDDTRAKLSQVERDGAHGGFGVGKAADQQDSKDNINKAEQGEGKINFTGKKDGKKSKGKGRGMKKGVLRKFGPTGGILGLMMFVFMGMSGFSGQSIFMQHLTAHITGRYDFVGFTSTQRANRIMRQKIGNATNVRLPNGLIQPARTFSSAANARFGRLNARTARRLGEHFDLLDARGNIIDSGGRVPRGEMVFIREKGAAAGDIVTADAFAGRMRNDPIFRSKVQAAYNGRVANWFDTKMNGIRSRMGLKPLITRGTRVTPADADPNLTPTEQALAAKNRLNTFDGRLDAGSAAEPFIIDGNNVFNRDPTMPGGRGSQVEMPVSEAQAVNSKVRNANSQLADTVNNLNVATGAGAPATTAQRVMGGITTALKFFSGFEIFCIIQQAAVSTHGLVRTLQRQDIMNAAAQALANMDSIRAGQADPDVIGALGGILFTTASYETIAEGSGSPYDDIDVERLDRDFQEYINYHRSESEPLAASEAQSFRWLTLRETIPEINGGLGTVLTGLGAVLLTIVNLFHTVEVATGGFVSTLCGWALNPWISIGVTVVGVVVAIALQFIPGAGQAATAATAGAVAGKKVVANQAIKAAVRSAMNKMLRASTAKAIGRGILRIGARMMLPFFMSWLAGTVSRIAAGQVCAHIFGQSKMNCIIVGSGAMYGEAAAGGGNLVLGKQHTAAMHAEFEEYLAMVAEDERVRRSPFDITSPHTFLGSMFTNVWPVMSTVSSVTGAFSAIGTISRATTISLLPTTNAFNLSDFSNSRELCEEPAVAGLGTDPFCNPVYGIPAGMLNAEETSPDRILNDFVARGWVRVFDEHDPDTTDANFGNIELLTRDANNNPIYNGLLTFQERCMNRGFMRPIDRNNNEDHMCIVFDDPSDDRSGLSEEEKVRRALFWIDYRIEDNMNGGGLGHVSDAALDFIFDFGVAHYDMTHLDDATILAIRKEKETQRGISGAIGSIFNRFFRRPTMHMIGPIWHREADVVKGLE